MDPDDWKWDKYHAKYYGSRDFEHAMQNTRLREIWDEERRRLDKQIVEEIATRAEIEAIRHRYARDHEVVAQLQRIERELTTS